MTEMMNDIAERMIREAIETGAKSIAGAATGYAESALSEVVKERAKKLLAEDADCAAAFKAKLLSAIEKIDTASSRRSTHW